MTRFRVKAEFMDRYEIQTVGGSHHQEYWIPAEDLPAFSAAVVGEIEIVAAFP